MTSEGYTSCSMELDPNINPVPSVVQDFPMFQHVGLIQESNGGDDKDSDIGIQIYRCNEILNFSSLRYSAD